MQNSPTLEVGFEIQTGSSFDELMKLQELMSSTEVKVMREAKKIEQATSGMVKLGGATVQINTFGNAYSRAMEKMAASEKSAERSAESMIRQMDRQILTFGKTTQEIREMNVAMRAAALESKGLTEAAGRLRATHAELQRLEAATDRVGMTGRRSGHAMMQFGMQMNDVGTMAALGAPPMQIFASQAGQIVQVFQMAEGGAKGFAKELAALALRFAPLIAVTGAAVGGFALFNRAVTSGVDMDPLIDSLGLTSDEIKKLENTSVTSGDVIQATFQVLANNIGIDMSNMTQAFGNGMDVMTQIGRQYLAALYSQFTGTFRAIGAIVDGVFSGKGIGDIMTDVGDAYKGAFREADRALIQFGKDVTAQVESNKLADLRRQAAEIRGDGSTPTRTRTDRTAERLARDAAATEAQIRNLYALADAYRESGAAALIAEARVKAESKAIKQRGDIEAAVNREVRLAIAERVSDVAKSTAAMQDQIKAQRAANDAVAAGLIPAQEAAQYVQDRIADLPLLAAIEAAQQRGLANEADRATQALLDQKAAREELKQAAITANFDAAMASGKNRLEELREELRLVGETEAARQMALATLRAEQEARAQSYTGTQAAEYIAQQQQIAQQAIDLKQKQDDYNASLTATADLFAIIDNAALNMADNLAAGFGKAGAAIGGALETMTGYYAAQADLQARHQAALEAAGTDEMRKERENLAFKLQSSQLQTDAMMGMTGAAKSLFKEHSSGYKVMMAAEKAMMVAQIARTAVDVAGGAAKMFSQLGIWAFPAVAAMGAVMASLGFFGGKTSSKNFDTKGNTGTGTVLGDSEAQSESIRRAIDSLREVDTLMLSSSRDMASSLRSIDSQIGSVAAILVRGGTITEGANVAEGFKPDFVGKLLGSIPLVGGLLGGLFGSKTSVLASGIYGGPQSLEDILGGGFDAQTYSDIKKKKKFFGVTTSTKYKTEYGGSAGDAVNDQFTLILKSFNDAILAAAGPLGASTNEIAAKLQDFVVDLGKIDLKDLTGEEIQEKLNAVFGAAADRMASYAFPGMERFQEVGEGLFETLVRVASTVESVTFSLDMLGTSIVGIDGKMDLADQFESLSQFSDAAQSYFESYYTKAEQNAAKEAQLAKVMNDLGFVMPDTLANFRSLVEAQDLTTAAGREAYAMLLKLAPAFADLKSAMDGARSAADILAERENLQKQILQLVGDTAALRAMELAKLDPSNRALQEQIYAIQDAQEAAKAAQELRDAWSSVGDSIMDEVARIRGLSGQQTGSNFATLMGQFNAATAAARAGDMTAAEDLPGISQAMLAAAALVARSRQELDRVQTDTAASLEATNAAIQAFASNGTSDSDILSAANNAQSASAANDTGDMVSELSSLKADLVSTLEAMRGETNNALSSIAGSNNRIARKLDDVTAASGGDAISTVYAA